MQSKLPAKQANSVMDRQQASDTYEFAYADTTTLKFELQLLSFPLSHTTEVGIMFNYQWALKVFGGWKSQSTFVAWLKLPTSFEGRSGQLI